MDITGFFGKEVFRPIVITLVPGIFTSAPLLAYLHRNFPGIQKLVADQATVAAILATALIIAAGFLMENLGSWIELGLCKIHARRNIATPPDDEIWYQFLRTHFATPPIGVHYLESIVLRLKFETSMIGPLVLLAIWIPVLTEREICDKPVLAMVGGLIVLVSWLMYESDRGCGVLARLRRSLLQGVHSM